MKILHRIGTLLLLAVFLTGFTGVSVVHHICRDSHTDNITLMPAVVEPGFPDCCDRDTPCDCSHGEYTSEEVHNSCLDASSCCSTTVSYLKLDIPVQRTESFVAGGDFLHPVADMVVFETIEGFTGDQGTPVPPTYRPPPVSGGRDLVLLLHQPKIPIPLFVA